MKMDENKKQLWKAVGFSFIVALVGAVLWGVIYQFGWFVNIIAYLTGMMMLKTFNSQYKTDKRWKYVYVVLTIVVLNIISSIVSLFVMYRDLSNSTSEAMRYIGRVLTSFNMFTFDIILGAICSAIGVMSFVKVEQRRELKENHFEKQQQERERQEQEELAQMRKMLEEAEEQEDKEDSQPDETKGKKEEVASQTSEDESEKPKHNFCTSCGARLSEGDTKCPACGADVED